MPTEAKERVVSDLVDYLKDAKGLVLTDFTGLTVEDATEFRRRCREANVDYRVVKNRLARLAVEQTGFQGVIDHFRGPTGIMTALEDPIAPARVVRAFAKQFGRPMVKIGWIEGAILEQGEVARLADLPSRDELLARVTAGIGGPLSGFVGTLTSLLQSLVGTLESIAKEKKE